MSNIKALDKLRTAARNMAKGRNLEHHEECNLLLRIADEIEAEIAERYMELPTDADGVPIRVGDKMQYHGGEPFTVCAVAPGVIHTWAVVKLGERKTTYDYAPAQCTHYKPRTLEDVLRGFGAEFDDYDDVWLNEKVAEYADEIRELLGVE